MAAESNTPSTFFHRFSMRWVLIVPFVLQVLLLAVLIGWLSFQNGQQAIDNLAFRLQRETTARIQQHLTAHLVMPHQINAINAEAIRLNLLDVEDPQALERQFWQHLTVFPRVNYVYMGSEAGGIIAPGRRSDGQLVVELTDHFAQGDYKVYSVDEARQRVALLNVVPGFDARERPWYQAAVAAGGPAWSDIYAYYGDQELGIAASRPVYNNQNELIGVLSSDLTLAGLSQFLQTLEVGQGGETFLIEDSGLIVASSTTEEPMIDTPESETVVRRHATESQVPLIAETTHFLQRQFQSLADITMSHQLKFTIDNQRYYLRVTPLQDERGLDWLIVVVIPEADFMAQINENTRLTFFLSAIVVLLTIGMGFLTSNWIVSPLSDLNQAAKNLAQGKWRQSTLSINRGDEVGQLAHSFSSMSLRLQAMFATIQASEEKYRTLFEDSHDAIVITTPEGVMLDYNTATLNLFGYDAETFSQINAVELYSDPNRRREFREVLDRQGALREFEAVVKHASGFEMVSILTATAHYNADGTVKNYHSIVRDVTKQREAARLLEEYNRTLEDEVAQRTAELEARFNEIVALNRITQMVASERELQAALSIVAREITKLIDTRSTGIALLNPAKTELEVVAYYSQTPDAPSSVGLIIPLENNPSSIQVVETARSLVVPDAKNNELTKPIHHVMRERNTECLLIVPLLARGEVIGTIGIDTGRPNRVFTEAEVSLAETIATQTAGAIENARLFEEEHQQREMAESLRHVAMIVNASLEQEAVLSAIMEQLGRVIQYDTAAIFLLEESVLRLVVGTGLVYVNVGFEVSLESQRPVVRVFQQQESVVIAEVREDPHWVVAAANEKVRAWMGVPLLVGDNVIGVLTTDSFKANAYTTEDARLLKIFGNQAAIAIQNAQLFAQTQAANRRLKRLNNRLQDELELARKIQQNLLPPSQPPWPGIDLVCYSKPAREVGGDLYTYHTFDERDNEAPQYALAVGDVSGKGMPAALLMAVSLASFQAVVQESFPPHALLAHLDEAIAPYTRTTRQNCALVYADIFLLNDKTRQVRIGNAGCVFPVVKYKDGRTDWVSVGGVPLGVSLGAEAGYEEINLTLERGDILIFTSDGVVEAKNQHDELFGFERLAETIEQGPQQANNMLTHLCQALADFVDDTEAHDDVTILVVQV